MNIENSWVLEKWHVRVACRRAGLTVPEESITLPPKTIRGPDLDIEGKEFYIKIKV